MRKVVLLLALSLLAAPGARAVIVAGGDGTQNTTAPANDPGWANVGQTGGATGIYLGNYGGNYWVLTASHIGAGAITLNNVSYSAVGGSAVTVRNGDNSPTDLTLFRISADPGLPTLTLATSAPAATSPVIMIGNGVNRAVDQIYWSVNTNGNPTGSGGGASWTWTSLGTNPAGSNASGYAYGSGSTKRWGYNTIEGGSSYDVGTGLTTALYTNFGTTSDPVFGFEAQGATFDSGGAVFHNTGGSNWELVGVMGAISNYNNQPTSTAVFGDLTFFGDVAAYNSFITSAIPEPADVALWGGAVAAAGASWLRRRGKRV